MGGARACKLPTALLRSCRSPAALPPLSRRAPAVLPPRSRRFHNSDDGRRLLSSCLPATTLRVFGIGGAVSACTSSLRIRLTAVALAPALAGALWPVPARQLRVALAQQRSRDRRAAARRVAPEHEDEQLAEVERRAHLEPHGRPGEHAAAPKVDEDCRAVHARAHAHGHQLLVVAAPHARRGSPRRSTPSTHERLVAARGLRGAGPRAAAAAAAAEGAAADPGVAFVALLSSDAVDVVAAPQSAGFRELLGRSLDSATLSQRTLPHNRTARAGAHIQQPRRARSAAV